MKSLTLRFYWRDEQVKHGRKPTLLQKTLIKEAGLNPANWLVVKNLSDQLHIVHRNTNSTRVISVA
jgi:hypothetical protein